MDAKSNRLIENSKKKSEIYIQIYREPIYRIIQESFMATKFELPETDISTNIAESLTSSLIVWNDEVNTFDWVIETLMDVCDHEREQAEQSAWLIHTKGKYAVKNGSQELLQTMCEAILERGIGATVETVPV